MYLITIGIIISAALTIGLVLIQDRSSGVGGAFGGGEGTVYQTRRGVERFVFIATIVLVIAFSGLSILNIYFRERIAASTPTAEMETSGITATDTNGNPVKVKITPIDPNTPAPSGN